MSAAGAMSAGAVGDSFMTAAWKTGAGAVCAVLSTATSQTFAPVLATAGRRLATGPVPAERGGPADGSTDKARERKSR